MDSLSFISPSQFYPSLYQTLFQKSCLFMGKEGWMKILIANVQIKTEEYILWCESTWKSLNLGPLIEIGCQVLTKYPLSRKRKDLYRWIILTQLLFFGWILQLPFKHKQSQNCHERGQENKPTHPNQWNWFAHLSGVGSFYKGSKHAFIINESSNSWKVESWDHTLSPFSLNWDVLIC